MYSTRILKDSIAPCGKRLTTWELNYPRFVHAELMTHRTFSRNSASSRAIPVDKLLKRISGDPAMPIWWGKNQAGMQSYEELDATSRNEAMRLWLLARDKMLEIAGQMRDLGLHKQIANRILEPWMFITVIVSATEFSNWFHLRTHHAAQPEIAWIAKEMWEKYNSKKPVEIAAGEWHLPLVSDDEISSLSIDILKKISTGRCARVSYLNHEGVRDVEGDIKLHDRLCAGPKSGEPGHWSPFEHVAMALDKKEQSGNFVGWKQYRKEFPDEHYERDL